MKIGSSFDLIVHEKHLDTGVHEYLVWYDAQCTVIPQVPAPMVRIHVECEMPEFARRPYRDGDSQSMLDCALANIKQGVGFALKHREHGLELKIVAFKLHPVDFQPLPFMLHTYYYTRRKLELMDSRESKA